MEVLSGAALRGCSLGGALSFLDVGLGGGRVAL